eukprot:TRINITY_DN510_c0_g1_i1.p1 TRINITY_DN510_c0_g1~~TRINITY_DN510_c0_g1_i1.p1  ORF type:complete len:296 (+),score=87.40 TRINITY_DN510_c0_g1_i1:29-889(+)
MVDFDEILTNYCTFLSNNSNVLRNEEDIIVLLKKTKEFFETTYNTTIDENYAIIFQKTSTFFEDFLLYEDDIHKFSIKDRNEISLLRAYLIFICNCWNKFINSDVILSVVSILFYIANIFECEEFIDSKSYLLLIFYTIGHLSGLLLKNCHHNVSLPKISNNSEQNTSSLFSSSYLKANHDNSVANSDNSVEIIDEETNVKQKLQKEFIILRKRFLSFQILEKMDSSHKFYINTFLRSFMNHVNTEIGIKNVLEDIDDPDMFDTCYLFNYSQPSKAISPQIGELFE